MARPSQSRLGHPLARARGNVHSWPAALQALHSANADQAGAASFFQEGSFIFADPLVCGHPAAAPACPGNALDAKDRPEIDARRLLHALTPFRSADDKRAALELAITAAPFVALWVATMLLVRAGIWAGLVLTIPAGGFLLRLFLIQHDCGHGSFFRRRRINGWAGRVIGVLTLTPYEFWRRSHAHHHAGTGNLDRRGLGDVDTLTLAEYRGLSMFGRCRYRLYRNPAVLFGLGPAYQFLLRHRVPVGLSRAGWRPWISAIGTDITIALSCLGMTYLVGAVPFFLVQLPITLVAATLGMWLFYIQHQFQRTSWEKDAQWSFHEAALRGSSYCELPPVLRWFSANIGVHHVHHLCSTIPYYRMPGVLRAFPELRTLGRLTFRQSLGSVRLALWDEESRRLISFRQARAA